VNETIMEPLDHIAHGLPPMDVRGSRSVEAQRPAEFRGGRAALIVPGAARARRIAGLAGLAIAAERGSALIFVAITLLIVGFFLFGFEALNLNEGFFAAFSRNSALAFDVAEAGAQEGINRLNMFGAIPGATCFVNSLESGATCSGSTSSPNANTVVYEATPANAPAVFPILVLADVDGATRAVRVLVQATYKSGFSNIIFGSNIFFYTPGNATSHGHNILRGAVFQQSNNSSIRALGTTQVCGGADHTDVQHILGHRTPGSAARSTIGA
jgi:hypothetical protein